MTGVEVAAVFKVHPKTVARWGDAGRLWYTRTPGGQRRYDPLQVRAIAAEAERPVVDV